MQEQDADEIIYCLPAGRTHFHYFRDRYALMLLSQFVGDALPIRDIKQSPYAKLLANPLVKPIVERQGGGVIGADMLSSVWPEQPECYLLTLGKWGADSRKKGWWRGYHQTSRRGTNLVLQLNFSRKHNKPYEDLIQSGDESPFAYSEHPIARRGFHTLAWARFDTDMENGEALIEEIQSDWVRLAARGHTTIETLILNEAQRQEVVQTEFRGVELDPKRLDIYVKHVLSDHMGLWSEAMLSAAIWFLTAELGIKEIYYHDFESGNVMKGLSHSKPPRSLYTSLPKKFCFQSGFAPPEFLIAGNPKAFRAIMEREQVSFWKLPL